MEAVLSIKVILPFATNCPATNCPGTTLAVPISVTFTALSVIVEGRRKTSPLRGSSAGLYGQLEDGPV